MPVIVPFVGENSLMQFYIPPTIQTDYTNQLNTDIPEFTHTYELVRDWYSQNEEGYEPIFLRATVFPIEWKSKVGNSDDSQNFKTDYAVRIRKGDMVIGEDKRVALLNWRVQEHINNQATQAIDCNANLEFTRYINDTLDSRGMLIEPAHDAVIVPSIPSSTYEYAGRPDYATANGSPGILPDALVQAQLQYNARTKLIQLNDEFQWFAFRYRVINIDYGQVEINGEYGILRVYGRRVGGEN